MDTEEAGQKGAGQVAEEVVGHGAGQVVEHLLADLLLDVCMEKEGGIGTKRKLDDEEQGGSKSQKLEERQLKDRCCGVVT